MGSTPSLENDVRRPLFLATRRRGLFGAMSCLDRVRCRGPSLLRRARSVSSCSETPNRRWTHATTHHDMTKRGQRQLRGVVQGAMRPSTRTRKHSRSPGSSKAALKNSSQLTVPAKQRLVVRRRIEAALQQQPPHRCGLCPWRAAFVSRPQTPRWTPVVRHLPVSPAHLCPGPHYRLRLRKHASPHATPAIGIVRE